MKTYLAVQSSSGFDPPLAQHWPVEVAPCNRALAPRLGLISLSATGSLSAPGSPNRKAWRLTRGRRMCRTTCQPIKPPHLLIGALGNKIREKPSRRTACGAPAAVYLVPRSNSHDAAFQGQLIQGVRKSPAPE
jgi:hypothetical protein